MNIYYFILIAGASPVTVEKPKISQELPLFSGSATSASVVSSRPAEPPRPSTADRYPPVAALAGEQLLARSGFQPYRPEERYLLNSLI